MAALAAQHETAAPPKLRVGLVAAPEHTPRLAHAIASCDDLLLTAQAGADRAALTAGAEWFDDRRVLIAQGPVDAVVLAVSPRVDTELTGTAAEHGKHIFRLPPLGRGFADVVEVVRRAQTCGVVLRGLSRWEHIAAAAHWALTREESFRPVLSELRFSGPGPGLDSCWSSLVDSGGGVLPGAAYALLESLVAVRGLPEYVSAVVGRCRALPHSAKRETEDVATALLRYEGGGMATIRAAWDVLETESVLLHHGATQTVRQVDSHVALLGAAGDELQRREFTGDWLVEELRRFVRDARTPAALRERDETTERHVAVSALIEASYLSARTGQPEAPRKLYEVQGWPDRGR